MTNLKYHHQRKDKQNYSIQKCLKIDIIERREEISMARQIVSIKGAKNTKLTQYGLPITCFQYCQKDGAESVLQYVLHNNSKILPSKALSAPSIGDFWNQRIGSPKYNLLTVWLTFLISSFRYLNIFMMSKSQL